MIEDNDIVWLEAREAAATRSARILETVPTPSTEFLNRAKAYRKVAARYRRIISALREAAR